jgi:hypothetical protein
MRKHCGALCIASAMFAGCTHHVAIVAPSAELSRSTEVIGIALAAIPRPAAFQQVATDSKTSGALEEGAQQLLVQTASEALQKLQADLARQLGDQGLPVRILTETVQPPTEGSGRSNWTPNVGGVNRVLILQLKDVGTLTHFGRAPNFMTFQTSQPFGYARAVGQLIDLRTRSLLWSTVSERTNAITGQWDQGPDKDAVNHSVKLALSAVGSDFLRDFATAHSMSARAGRRADIE